MVIAVQRERGRRGAPSLVVLKSGFSNYRIRTLLPVDETKDLLPVAIDFRLYLLE